ncbi:robin [Cotonvirus japonicus]|uniref:Robin n=1 Tax=Cotonvirus japonicus TaxID=2811091 RepID=A0ABM7NSI4_9VIRU|nr:robin [Cotonvirus japonicus]BCS83124.1 robin [Cotonvirus japonicus]
MKHYSFASNYLRTYANTIIFSFKYIVKPVNHDNLLINILHGEQNLENLIYLIPKVRVLKLNFFDSCVKYDLKPISKLLNLRELYIISNTEIESRPRLLNINILSNLCLDNIIVYGNILDGKNVIYHWPKIRNPIFLHINSITKSGSVINYDIKKRFFHKNLLGGSSMICCDNIILQIVNDSEYQAIYRTYEAYSEDQIHVTSISKIKFLKFIYADNVYNHNLLYPTCQEDLYMDDLD